MRKITTVVKACGSHVVKGGEWAAVSDSEEVLNAVKSKLDGTVELAP